MRAFALGLALTLALATPGAAQRAADPDVDLSVARPVHARGEGPVVAVDAHHRNYHTADGLYGAFATLLTNDGFRVQGLDKDFTAGALAGIDVLVIANAGHIEDPARLADPAVSAFSKDEIAAVKAWVERGGALLLIADHRPFSGAATDLGRAFGMEFHDGYVSIPRTGTAPDVFTRANGGVADGPVTRGRGPEERVDTVGTFTGSAFTAPPGATPVLFLPKGAKSVQLTADGRYDPAAPGEDVAGLLQGATLKVGKGRIAVFGEAAMFSAQLAGPQQFKMGFNNPAAPNKQLVLNLVRWLAGDLPD